MAFANGHRFSCNLHMKPVRNHLSTLSLALGAYFYGALAFSSARFQSRNAITRILYLRSRLKWTKRLDCLGPPAAASGTRASRLSGCMTRRLRSSTKKGHSLEVVTSPFILRQAKRKHTWAPVTDAAAEALEVRPKADATFRTVAACSWRWKNMWPREREKQRVSVAHSQQRFSITLDSLSTREMNLIATVKPIQITHE